MANVLRAVLLVSGDDREASTALCVKHCNELGYRVTSIVYDRADHPEAWRDAYAAVAMSSADVVVHAGPTPSRTQRAGQPARNPLGMLGRRAKRVT